MRPEKTILFYEQVLHLWAVAVRKHISGLQ